MRDHRNTNWKKSTRSDSAANCVEVRLDNGIPLVRDSKLGNTSPIFALGLDDFTAFLGAMDADAMERKE